MPALIGSGRWWTEPPGGRVSWRIRRRWNRQWRERYSHGFLTSSSGTTCTGEGLGFLLMNELPSVALTRRFPSERWRHGSERLAVRLSGGSFADLNEDLPGNETLVAYAAAGTTGADGWGKNSPYTGGAAVARGDAAGERAAVPSGTGAGAGYDERRAASARVPLAGRRGLPDEDADHERVRHGERVVSASVSAALSRRRLWAGRDPIRAGDTLCIEPSGTSSLSLRSG